jgi:hypothetical protein
MPGLAGHQGLNLPASLVEELVRERLGERVDGLRAVEQEWGRSKALHFVGRWAEDGAPVVIKVRVGPAELYWTRALARVRPDLGPRLYDSDADLGGYEIGWVVAEHIPYGPLGPLWAGAEFRLMLEAGVGFQAAARQVPARHVGEVSRETIAAWIERGIAEGVPGPAAELLARLEADFARVASLCPPEVCHGDLHLCNGLSRLPPPSESPAVLIDCQPVMQPWPLDAAYLEVLAAADASRPGRLGHVALMAAMREEAGLPMPSATELEGVARTALAWMAASLWGSIPERRGLADVQAETRRYVEEGVAAGV